MKTVGGVEASPQVIEYKKLIATQTLSLWKNDCTQGGQRLLALFVLVVF